MTNKELKDLQKSIIDRLNKELPKQLHYHSPAHTLRVLEKAEIIAKHENVSKRDIKLIKIAALFHDSGFIKSSVNHEELSCLIAKEYLKNKPLREGEIDKICGMIMATKIPQNPQNQLEEILADADLEYLGTEDFEKTSGCLFKELKLMNPGLTEEKWNKIQVEFIEKHTYFTSYGKKHLSETKEKHLATLKDTIKR